MIFNPFPVCHVHQRRIGELYRQALEFCEVSPQSDSGTARGVQPQRDSRPLLNRVLTGP
jgi:hypothetical protein